MLVCCHLQGLEAAIADRDSTLFRVHAAAAPCQHESPATASQLHNEVRHVAPVPEKCSAAEAPEWQHAGRLSCMQVCALRDQLACKAAALADAEQRFAQLDAVIRRIAMRSGGSSRPSSRPGTAARRLTP